MIYITSLLLACLPACLLALLMNIDFTFSNREIFLIRTKRLFVFKKNYTLLSTLLIDDKQLITGNHHYTWNFLWLYANDLHFLEWLREQRKLVENLSLLPLVPIVINNNSFLRQHWTSFVTLIGFSLCKIVQASKHTQLFLKSPTVFRSHSILSKHHKSFIMMLFDKSFDSNADRVEMPVFCVMDVCSDLENKFFCDCCCWHLIQPAAAAASSQTPRFLARQKLLLCRLWIINYS